jgi:hypothetical protein
VPGFVLIEAITRGDPCKGRAYIETAAVWFRKNTDDYAYDWNIFLDSLAVLIAAEGEPTRAVHDTWAGGQDDGTVTLFA